MPAEAAHRPTPGCLLLRRAAHPSIGNSTVWKIRHVFIPTMHKATRLTGALFMAVSSHQKRLRLIAFLMVLMPPLPAYAETLGDALAAAYQSNPGVEASRAATRASRERVRQAKAQFGPTLIADAGYSYNGRRVTQNGATMLTQNGFTRQVSLSLDQPLFTFGRLSAQHRIADAGYGASIADMRSAEQDLMANVIIAYAAVLRDQKLVDIARENLSQLSRQLDQIDARYSARYATETDLQQTRNRIFSGQAQLELAQGALLASRNTYRSLVGNYPSVLSPLPQLPPLPRTIDEAQFIGRSASPVLEAARRDLTAAQARIAQARGNARPYVGIQGNLAHSPLNIETDRVRDLTAQIQLAITAPLYSAGLLSARIREAVQLADAASQQLEQTSRNLREDIANYWDQLSAARRALPAYTRAISAAQSAFNGAQQQQLAGQITSLDVLDTARDLLNARQAQAQAEAQLYVQHALLLGAMGQLRVDAFGADTPTFDPSSYDGLEWAGLPSGLIIEAVDGLGLDNRFIPSSVAVERDSEPGHIMAPPPGDQ